MTGPRPVSSARGIVCSTSFPLLRERGPLDTQDAVDPSSTRGSLGMQLSGLVGVASAAEIHFPPSFWIWATGYSYPYPVTDGGEIKAWLMWPSLEQLEEMVSAPELPQGMG